jgi:hypothetical protein
MILLIIYYIISHLNILFTNLTLLIHSTAYMNSLTIFFNAEFLLINRLFTHTTSKALRMILFTIYNFILAFYIFLTFIAFLSLYTIRMIKFIIFLIIFLLIINRFLTFLTIFKNSFWHTLWMNQQLFFRKSKLVLYFF